VLETLVQSEREVLNFLNERLVANTLHILVEHEEKVASEEVLWLILSPESWEGFWKQNQRFLKRFTAKCIQK
jgi:hypothetical protein